MAIMRRGVAVAALWCVSQAIDPKPWADDDDEDVSGEKIKRKKDKKDKKTSKAEKEKDADYDDLFKAETNCPAPMKCKKDETMIQKHGTKKKHWPFVYGCDAKYNYSAAFS